MLRLVERFSRPVGDRGDVVLGWLTRLVVVLGVVGVLAFDGISVVASRLAVEDTAVLAAREASDRWTSTRDPQAAYDAARTAAVESNPLNEVLVEDFVLHEDGSVSLVVRREATTFLLHRTSRTAPWAVVEAAGTGRRI